MQTNWQEFVEQEISYFKPILNDLGFTINSDQPHTKGERGSVINGLGFKVQEKNNNTKEEQDRKGKIILLGEKDGQKVVIKCSRYEDGVQELLEEKQARENIKKIDFAYHEFLEPREIYFYAGLAPSPKLGEGRGEVVIQVTEFIIEEKKFTEREPKEQFDLIYRSFVVQEGVHAVTAKHNRLIKKLFRTFDFEAYRHNLSKFKEIISFFLKNHELEGQLAPLFEKGQGEMLELVEQEFLQNKHRISQFCGFLTHTDFVPHNFRVRNENGVNKIYLLDHSAIVVGNKHDGWARFMNFAVLHVPLVEKWFMEYFRVNRSEEEQESLRLMRLYRLFELSSLYSLIYQNSKNSGNVKLEKLSEKRVYFWLEVMKSVFENREVDRQIVEDYKKNRDSLRTQSEKERQQVIY